MTFGKFSALFDIQAMAYSKFRPSYPQELFDVIFEYADFSSTSIVAADLATGSGQTAVDLAKRCNKIIAIDSNWSQLHEAKTAANIVYKQGFAENTGLPDASVDLVTVSQAFHWFELNKAFLEVARILKPGGTLAAWCYGIPEVLGNELASQLIWDLRFGANKLGPYWSARNKLVDEGYASVLPDTSLYENTALRRLYGSQTSTVDSLVGFFESWSAYYTFKQQNPQRHDLMSEFKKKLMFHCRLESGTEAVKIRWPIYLLVTRTRL